MMEENWKSLVVQYDSFINSTLRFLDTTIERDYMLKLKIIDELTYKINEGETDKKTIKNTLEEVQGECSKLSYKLKTSARLLDEVQVDKEKLLVENQTLKSELEKLFSGFKKPDHAETSQTRISKNNSHLNNLDKKMTLNNTDAMLSDLSYSYSEDSSCEHITQNCKPQSALIKKCTTSNILSNINSKTHEIKNLNMNGGQIIATTTLTMDLGCVNAKSIIKTHPIATSKALPISSSSSVESLSSYISDKELELKTSNNIDTHNEKEHNFVQKIIVIPEICGQCHSKIKFNSYMVKCLNCKTVAHLECKDHIPTICTLDQNKLNALNCGIPPLIVHCISEIERRGMDVIGLYRVSGSDKEVKSLRDKFHKEIPSLNNVDVHVLCSCLKDFIRTEKNNLISQNNLSKLTYALENSTNVSESLSQCINELPSMNRNILAFLILHLQKVASSPKCNMDYNCLAIVFGPTIVGLSSTCLDDLQIKSEIIFKVVIELLKLPQHFWNNVLKTNTIAPDELLHSTPVQTQSKTPGSTHRFFTSGLKRRILDSPQKNKIKKQVEFRK